jgi:sugar phosphate isomerase/epimerase
MKRQSLVMTVSFAVLVGGAFAFAIPRSADNLREAKSKTDAFEAFKGRLGLQLYSLRFEFKKNGIGPTLDWAQSHGFKILEGGGTYGLTRDQYLYELNKRGMKVIGTSATYEDLRDGKVDAVIENAKAFGAESIMCAWIPHKGQFSMDDVRAATDVFNKTGAKIKSAGIQFCYHPHGYEFVPTANGTLFDELVTLTDPKSVGFELDVFWAKHGGADPSKLLEKYPRRFKLMHLKDLQKGVSGNLTGSSPDETSVSLGSGQVDWPAVLKAAKRSDIKYYFIEEESPDATRNIPESLEYLAKVRLR